MKNTTPQMRAAINHCKTFSLEDLRVQVALETRMITKYGHGDWRYVEAMKGAIQELEAEMEIAA
jgi:hypothetical protein